jgi:Zn-dependent alcohol dehydrogenase
VVVHERVALPTGGRVPLEQAALLGCAALTGVGAVVHAAGMQPGSTVAVVGAGAVGQFVVQGARLAGAATIVVADLHDARRAQAMALGATVAVAPSELAAALAAVAPDGAAFAFDAVGDPATTVVALDATCPGGTCVIVGIPSVGARLDLEPAQFIRREKWLTGTMYGSEDPAVALPALLDLVTQGRLELDGLTGPVFPLDEVNAAVEAALSGVAGRVLVRP